MQSATLISPDTATKMTTFHFGVLRVGEGEWVGLVLHYKYGVLTEMATFQWGLG